MQKIYLSIALLACTGLTFSQTGKTKDRQQPYTQTRNTTYDWGTVKDFVKSFIVEGTQSRKAMNLQLSATKSIDVKIIEDQSEGQEIRVYGEVIGVKTSIFYIYGNASEIKGQIVIDSKDGYELSTDAQTRKVIVTNVDINELICVMPTTITNSSNTTEAPAGKDNTPAIAAQPAYSSDPNAPFVLYLDFDGEYVDDSYWNSQMGGAKNCAGPNFTDAKIKSIWAGVAEKFRPWNINVTTDRALFNGKTKAMRHMVIYTNSWGSGGGVASIGSIANNGTDICWVFFHNLVNDVNDMTVTGAHEAGHAFGLQHDGNSSSNYYGGHGNWGPIMGNNYQTAKRDVWQWSKGEYNGATHHGGGANTQDDVAIIAGNPGVGYRTDEHGNATSSATTIVTEPNGTVLASKNNGIITTRTDKDYFKFTTTGGTVTFNFQSGTRTWTMDEAVLDIQARLLDASGTELALSNPTIASSGPNNGMDASISKSVAAGTYYIEVDGVGYLNPSTTGYSDYCSLGIYYISGTVPPPTNNPVPEFTANVVKLCEGTQVTYTDQTTNGATSWKWSFPGGVPASSTAQNPTVTYNSSGTYDAKLVAQNANGKDSLTKTSYITVDNAPNAPSTTGDSRCSAGIVNLSATGSGGTLEWYTASTGGSPVTTGATYAPNLATTTTYYVSEAGTSPSQKAGPVTNTIGAGGYFTDNDIRGLLFDVLGACTLKTVKVYANTAGNRTIEVLSSVGGTVLHTKTVNIPAGESRVTLDFALQPGTQYHIKVTGTLVDLYRNNAGASYPYTLANLISITETDYAGTTPGYYYYFYDWELITSGCSSARTAVTGTINTNPATPTITQNGVILTSSAPSGNQWYLDGNLIPGATGQDYTVTQNGNYTVKVTLNGCESTASLPFNFTSTADIAKMVNTYFLNVYPNPGNGNFNISFNVHLKSDYKLELRNILGQVIYQEALTDFTGAYSRELSVMQYGKGIYMISLISAESEAIKKVVVY